MNEPQSVAIVKLLSDLTHAVVTHSNDLPHNTKVELLDELCEVKRQFNIEECPQPT